MGSDIPIIASYTLTPWGGLYTCLRPDSMRRHTSNGHQSKVIFNRWIHQEHHNPNHWWHNLGGASQKRGIIDDPHHILATSDLRTAKLGQPPLTPQTSRLRVPFIAQYMSGMGHPDLLTAVIPPQRNGGGLGKWHQGLPSLNKNKNGQTGIPHRKYQ